MKGVLKQHYGIKVSKGDKTFYSIVTVILLFITAAVLYPILYVVSASFSSGAAVTTGKVILWPVDITLDGYRGVFTYQRVAAGFKNSIIYTVLGTVINVTMTMMAAYALSRKNFQGRRVYTTLFIITMFFSGGLIPSYILITQLHLINSMWAILLPGAISTYNMIITRTFFMTSIPNDLLEASQIDGCSNIRFFFVILLPLSKAIIAVIALYYGIGHWNAWFAAMLYLRAPELHPLQLVLREILIMSNFDLSNITDPETIELMMNMAELLKFSLIVVSTIPVIVVYPFIQKYFIKGALIGSLKG
jgi:multiple sugar transport system permease protein/putative aldouronate transport system permease protein